MHRSVLSKVEGDICPKSDQASKNMLGFNAALGQKKVLCEISAVLEAFIILLMLLCCSTFLFLSLLQEMALLYLVDASCF